MKAVSIRDAKNRLLQPVVTSDRLIFLISPPLMAIA
jgi:hypothetical protein